jgi:signal transduction histidine kinase
VLLLENKWSQKDIELSLDLEEIFIEGNEELLKQIWINLTDNAIKFSPRGEVVSFEIETDDENVTVKIKNKGSISDADIRKIWNKFYQADKSHTTEGNGIGLAIVNRIVELHGGVSEVESEDGQVCFAITLPCEQL